MSIKFALGKDGSFTVGDTATGLTAYAYPTSSNASEAKRLSKRWDAQTRMLMLAIDMVKNETIFSGVTRDQHDARNWKRLGGREAYVLAS